MRPFPIAFSLLLGTSFLSSCLARAAEVPNGYDISEFAALDGVNAMIWGPDDRLWAGSGSYVVAADNRIVAFSRDGTEEVFDSGLSGFVDGLVWVGEDLYVSGENSILLYPNALTLGAGSGPETVITGLPSGAHENNNMVWDEASGWIYFGNGSVSNTSVGGENGAAINRFRPEDPQGTLEEYATGLRNAYDLVITPDGTMFATENGRDDNSCAYHDEVNHIIAGGFYGFPDDTCYPPEEDGTIAPIALLDEDAGATGIAYNSGIAFCDYLDTLFVNSFGAWGSSNGYKTETVRLTTAGETFTGEVETFATGGNFSPVDLTFDPEFEHLYIGSHSAGKILIVSPVDKDDNGIADHCQDLVDPGDDDDTSPGDDDDASSDDDDASSDDDDESGDDDAPHGGCSQGSGSPAGFPALLLIALTLPRLRRRSAG